MMKYINFDDELNKFNYQIINTLMSKVDKLSFCKPIDKIFPVDTLQVVYSI